MPTSHTRTTMAGFISLSDIVSLIQAISAAVETVNCNKEECRVIAERVNRIHQVLNQRKTKESSESLHVLQKTLQEILAFVTKFRDANYLRKFYNRNTGEM